MHSSLTLIGMPGAGKSVIGKLLAQRLNLDFVDTDKLIESSHKTSLQSLLDDRGYFALRQLEEKQIVAMTLTNQVIATGGSAVYSEVAMQHLKTASTIIFLDIPLKTVEQRIDNFDHRGIARAPHQNLEDIFQERYPLYLKHADIQVDNDRGSAEKVVKQIITVANCL